MKRSPLQRKTPLKRTQITKKRPMLKRTKINTASKDPKKVKERKEYKNLRRDYLLNNPTCQFVDKHGVRCEHQATDIHHKAGRGRLLNDINYWMGLCRHCHDFIHNNQKWAMEVGFLVHQASLNKKLDNESHN